VEVQKWARIYRELTKNVAMKPETELKKEIQLSPEGKWDCVRNTVK
jgi:hypothetical protein